MVIDVRHPGLVTGPDQSGSVQIPPALLGSGPGAGNGGPAGILVLPADFSAYLAEAPLYLFWAVAAAANLIHRPLEPWCPRCNWGDGGDEEDVPAPPPVPVATNTH